MWCARFTSLDLGSVRLLLRYGDYITFMAPIELDDESLYPLAAVSTYRGDKVPQLRPHH